MTTPKQDLTVEQIENFRSYCHAYLEKIGPTHALIDRVCDLARKGIEDWQPIEIAKEDRNLTIQIAYKAGPSWCIRQGWWDGEPGIWTDGQHSYRPSHWKRLPSPPTPQKPEPSGGFPTWAYQNGEPLPSPAPGDKDVEHQAELRRRLTVPLDDEGRTGHMLPPSPSGSVEGLVAYVTESCMRLKHGECRTLRCLKRGGYEYGKTQATADMATCEEFEIAEALKRLEQENGYLQGKAKSWEDAALKRTDEWQAMWAERDRISLEVGRLKKVAEDYIRELTTATQNAAACASLPITSSARIEARVRLEQLETKLRDARNALAGGKE